MDRNSDIEKETGRIGRELYLAIKGVPAVFDSRRMLGRIMERAMKNEDFKIILFRFIDVLPSLKTDDLVVKLLHEYFSRGAGIPGILDKGMGLVPESGIGFRITAPIIRKAVAAIARQFISGHAPREMAKTLDTLRSGGFLFTVDLLGEVVLSDKEAEAYFERSLILLDQLHARYPDGSDVSLKISSFYSQLDPVDWDGSVDRTKSALRPILRKAIELGISVTFDMEHYHFKALIISIFKSLVEEDEFAKAPGLGIALQTYLKDTDEDLRILIEWARARNRKITVRLVKGAYWDHEYAANRQKGWPVPVFLNKEETDAAFERLTGMLLRNRDIVRPAIATHNLRSIAHAIALVDFYGNAKEDFEIQMLYGMAEPLRKAVRDRGFTVRIYTPAGELIPGMAYLVRRLLENTSNLSFLRMSFSERAPVEELMKKPVLPRQERSEKQSAEGFKNEPLLDFSLEWNRRGMRNAITAVKHALNGSYPLIIGNRKVRTEREILSRNPARPQEVVGRVSSAAKKECDAALSEAIKAQDEWRRTGPEKRAEYLFQAAAELRRRRMELAALEVIEVGKTWADADGDVAEAIDYLEYYGREMIRLGTPNKMGSYPGEENEYLYRAKGIGVVIAPWNFPLAIAAGMTSAAIVTGNCALFKPSGLSPVIGYQLCDVFQSTGLPPGVLQFLPGPGSEVGEYLVSHPAVDFIAFTGSRDVGLRIVQRAAEVRENQRSVKKVIAELGGKNAVIVDETADLDEAVKGIIESAFGYQGQKCSACSRVIVVGMLYQEFCHRLREAVNSIRIGPPEDPSNSMGPLIDESAFQKTREYIEIGKRDGMALIVREETSDGYFAGPAVFVDIRPGSRLATEEIFGPVLAVMRAKDIDEAISLANQSDYALTGGLFSRSPVNIQKIRQEFLTGNLYINRKITGALVGRQPFGGFRMSGVGSKAGGPDYLIQFLNPISISENTIRKGFVTLGKQAI